MIFLSMFFFSKSTLYRKILSEIPAECQTVLDPDQDRGSVGPDLRVGSHVVSVRIHCTEKWRTSFHTDVLSKSK